MLRPIQPFLDRPDVTEVTINRPQELWLKTFQGWERADAPPLSMSYLDMLATSIITFNQMQARSIVSVVLPGGERAQIVRPPALINGTVSISIRKHAQVTKTLEQLAEEGAFDDYIDVSFNQPTAGEAARARAPGRTSSASRSSRSSYWRSSGSAGFVSSSTPAYCTSATW